VPAHPSGPRAADLPTGAPPQQLPDAKPQPVPRFFQPRLAQVLRQQVTGLYLGCRDLGVDQTRRTAGRTLATGNWRTALNQFDPMFPGRLDRARHHEHRSHTYTGKRTSPCGRNIATVAVARKLLTLVYYGLRDGHIRALASPVMAA
jgi:hypothetical protein